MTSTRNNPPVEQNGYLAFIVQTSPDNLKLALLPPMTLVRTRARWSHFNVTPYAKDTSNSAGVGPLKLW